MDLYVVKVRNMAKKSGEGEFYIADILVVSDKISGIFQQFISLEQYKALVGLINDKVTFPIDKKYLETKLINNELVERVNFDNLLSNI